MAHLNTIAIIILPHIVHEIMKYLLDLFLNSTKLKKQSFEYFLDLRVIPSLLNFELCSEQWFLCPNIFGPFSGLSFGLSFTSLVLPLSILKYKVSLS